MRWAICRWRRSAPAPAIYDLLIGFALGIGNGLAIVTARSYGADDTELLKKSVAASIVIGLLTSLVLTVGAEVILMPLLKMLDTPPEIIAVRSATFR